MCVATVDHEAYWASRLVNRQPVDAAHHARLFAAGLTKHDLPTINAAYAEWADAHDLYVAAYRSLWDAITAIVPKEHQQYVGWQMHAPERAKELLCLHDDIYSVTPGIGPHGPGGCSRGDNFPVGTWRKNAGKYRSATRKIRKALLSGASHASHS